MRHLLHIISGSITVAALMACSNQQTTHAFNPASAPEDQAAIYLYRPLSTTNAFYSPDLYINDEFAYSIKSGKKIRLLLDAGTSVFEIEPDKNYSGVTRVSKNLQAGDTYYLRIDTSLKIQNTLGYEPYERSFSLVEVADKQAVAEISECCHSASNSNKDGESRAGSNPSASQNDDSDTGFSVDKTQNPFSH